MVVISFISMKVRCIESLYLEFSSPDLADKERHQHPSNEEYQDVYGVDVDLMDTHTITHTGHTHMM